MNGEAALALGADVTLGSALEAGPVSGQGVLRLTSLELPAQALLDLVGAFLEGVVDLVVVALFRAAAVSSIKDRLHFGSGVMCPEVSAWVEGIRPGSPRVFEGGESLSPRVRSGVKGGSGEDTLVGVDRADEVSGSDLVVGEVMTDLVLKEGETSQYISTFQVGKYAHSFLQVLVLLLSETFDLCLGGVLLFLVVLIAPNGGANHEGELIVEDLVEGASERCLSV